MDEFQFVWVSTGTAWSCADVMAWGRTSDAALGFGWAGCYVNTTQASREDPLGASAATSAAPEPVLCWDHTIAGVSNTCLTATQTEPTSWTFGQRRRDS